MAESKFKCKYCGSEMTLKMGFHGASCHCSHCGSCGPIIDPHGLSEKEIVDKMRLLMSGSVVTVDVTKEDRVRKDLQIVSGRYAALKAGDLPHSERNVRKYYDEFKRIAFRNKGQSFHDWIKEMAEATHHLELSLSYRERALRNFVKTKEELRRLQKELDDENGKNGVSQKRLEKSAERRKKWERSKEEKESKKDERHDLHDS